MAQKDSMSEKTKTNKRASSWYGLVAFVSICVVLVVFTWAENFSDNAADVPGYYRNTSVLDRGSPMTVTIEAADPLLQETPQHRGTPRNAPTIAPTIAPTTTPLNLTPSHYIEDLDG